MNTLQHSFQFTPNQQAANESDPAWSTELGRKARIKRERHDDSKWLRLCEQIRQRDNNLCCSCNAFCHGEIDHRIELIDGGDNSPVNLQLLCIPCHRQKTAFERWKRWQRQLQLREDYFADRISWCA